MSYVKDFTWKKGITAEEIVEQNGQYRISKALN